MRKAIKFCLALAMVGSMASVALADVTFTSTGHANGVFTQTSSKAAVKGAKAVSIMDMAADGELGLKAVSKGDAWTATGFIEFDSTEAAVTPRDIWAQVENDALLIRFGRQYADGVQKGGSYYWNGTYNGWAGEYLGGRKALVKVGLKEVGLNIWYGMNENPGVGTQYNRTTTGLTYAAAFGDIDLAATYVSEADSINKDNGGTEKGANDGATQSTMALGAKYNMDKMHVSFNYESASKKAGTASAEAMAYTNTEFFFDMDMEGTLSGISANYRMYSQDTWNTTLAKKYADESSAMSFAAAIPTGAATVYVEYGQSSTKNTAPSSETATGSELRVTMNYSF